MRVTGFEQRAQTNTQLYGQLLASGWGVKDVARVRDAYALGAEAFAGQLRPDGRPFVCHLVGVASVLAMIGAAHDTIIAGLLHSAYTHGDFGLGRGRMTRKARDRLRAAAGPQIESLVAVYARHPWNAATVAAWVDNAGTLAADARQIIVIRLADAVEDALDHGLQLSAKMENPNRAISVESLVILANAVGQPRLGAALRDVLQAGDDGMDLSLLRASQLGSYVVCPASWREKMLPRFVRLVRRMAGASPGPVG